MWKKRLKFNTFPSRDVFPITRCISVFAAHKNGYQYPYLSRFKAAIYGISKSKTLKCRGNGGSRGFWAHFKVWILGFA